TYMNSADLQTLAKRSRSMRETGLALLFASALLALPIVVPILLSPAPTPTVAVETPATPNPFADIQLEAKASIVYDLVTKETLYAENADAQLPLASLTKLLTVYAAVSELSPSTPITISADAVRLEAPRAFNEGQTFSLADLA